MSGSAHTVEGLHPSAWQRGPRSFEKHPGRYPGTQPPGSAKGPQLPGLPTGLTTTNELRHVYVSEVRPGGLVVTSLPTRGQERASQLCLAGVHTSAPSAERVSHGLARSLPPGQLRQIATHPPHMLTQNLWVGWRRQDVEGPTKPWPCSSAPGPLTPPLRAGRTLWEGGHGPALCHNQTQLQGNRPLRSVPRGESGVGVQVGGRGVDGAGAGAGPARGAEALGPSGAAGGAAWTPSLRKDAEAPA